jgi:hypothetical protein
MIVNAAEATAFIAQVRENPVNAALMDRLPLLGLNDCWLVAGCLFQTIWNVRAGRPPTEQIVDYDVFYFDAGDLSYEAEDAEIKRLAVALADLDASVELRNQARVHLWYRQRFGHEYPQLRRSTDGIDRFLVECTCVGIACVAGRPPIVHATHGLEDLYAGILRPNGRNHAKSRYQEKASSYARRWPWLRIFSAAPNGPHVD